MENKLDTDIRDYKNEMTQKQKIHKDFLLEQNIKVVNNSRKD